MPSNANLLARLQRQRESTLDERPEGPVLAPRWRWLGQEEGLAAVGGSLSAFFASNETRMAQADNLQADVSAIWEENLTKTEGPPAPAVGCVEIVNLSPAAIWVRDADGELVRDERGQPKLAPQEGRACNRLRVASVLLEETSGFVFALGFTGKTGPGAFVSLAREMEIETQEREAWASMKGQFARGGKDPVRPLPLRERVRMGRLGEALAPPHRHPGAFGTLSALREEMAAGFEAFSVKAAAAAEAACLAREMRMDAPGKRRRASRI